MLAQDIILVTLGIVLLVWHKRLADFQANFVSSVFSKSLPRRNLLRFYRVLAMCAGVAFILVPAIKLLTANMFARYVAQP